MVLAVRQPHERLQAVNHGAALPRVRPGPRCPLPARPGLAPLRVDGGSRALQVSPTLAARLGMGLSLIHI
eukprot:13878992-Alexandrium_andersonii.AAC.1